LALRDIFEQLWDKPPNGGMQMRSIPFLLRSHGELER